MSDETIDAQAMRMVMTRREWRKVRDSVQPSGLVYEVWDHPIAQHAGPGDVRNVLLPTRRMGDGLDDARVRAWAEAVAERCGDVTADAIVAEAAHAWDAEQW